LQEHKEPDPKDIDVLYQVVMKEMNDLAKEAERMAA
jgi:hypothetical protein